MVILKSFKVSLLIQLYLQEKLMTNDKNSLEKFKQELEEDLKRFEETRSTDSKKDASRSKSDCTMQSRSSVKQSNVHSSHHSSHNYSKTSDSHRVSHYSHHKKKKKRLPRLLCFLLALILLIGVGGYGFLHWELGRIQRNINNDITDTEIKENVDTKDEFGLGEANANPVNDPNITNILLIGQDRREGDKAEMRSDAMIICSINSKTKNISLTSLMRDMYLPIPEFGYGLLNSTYLIGGFDLLNDTIEKNFGIPIHGDMEVDFSRFVELMDIVGPIELSLSEREATFLNNLQGTNWSKQSGTQNAGDGLTAGKNTMNSKQVLLYCRMRHNIGGDWGRTDRQRKVIMACFNKLKHAGAKDILSFTHQAMPLLSTNMTNTSIIKLAYAAVSYNMDASQSHRLPYEGSYTQEVKEDTLHVLVPDLKKNLSAIQKYIYDY